MSLSRETRGTILDLFPLLHAINKILLSSLCLLGGSNPLSHSFNLTMWCTACDTAQSFFSFFFSALNITVGDGRLGSKAKMVIWSNESGFSPIPDSWWVLRINKLTPGQNCGLTSPDLTLFHSRNIKIGPWSNGKLSLWSNVPRCVFHMN